MKAAVVEQIGKPLVVHSDWPIRSVPRTTP